MVENFVISSGYFIIESWSYYGFQIVVSISLEIYIIIIWHITHSILL